MIDAVILVGGQGTRLREVVPHLPKPLAPVAGRPFLDILIQQLLESATIGKIVLAVGYRADNIVEYYRKMSLPVVIEFSYEEEPLGTGGALLQALGKTTSELVLAMNGDSYLDYNIKDFLASYRSPITLACVQVQNASRYGRVEMDSAGRIVRFCEKQPLEEAGLVNAGIYLLERTLLEQRFGKKFSIETDAFPVLLQDGMWAYPVAGDFIDIGTKDSYELAQRLFEKDVR